MIASYVAVPGGLLCVFRSLARVLDTRCATLVPDKKQRWCNRGMEILFCVVVPLLSMATHIFYQKSRYMVYQVSGCINNFDDSPISLALAFIWPPIICLPACWYCGMYANLFITRDLWLTLSRSGSSPSTSVSKPIRGHPQRIQQQHQQIPIHTALFPKFHHACRHLPDPMLRCLAKHSPLVSLAYLFLERSPWAGVEYNRQVYYRWKCIF